jgi:ligand-binding sensor domain-containing protein/signal transduction histidine kinase
MRKTLGAALVWWAFATASAGQQPERWVPLSDPVFQSFSQEQGLPASLYNAVAEDGDGFLWFGGGKALFRWDGYRFHGYQADPGNPQALQDNYVLCIYRDSRGQIWIGTSGGGLARYDRGTDGFVTIGAGPNGLANASVDAIAEDGDGGLWVGTEGGLDHIFKDGRIAHWTHRDGDAASLPDDRVTRLWRDKMQRLWIGTRGGLARLDPDQPGFLRIPLPPPGNPNPTIWALAGDEGGRMWVGTLGQGAYVFEPGPGISHAAQVSDLGAESVGALVEGMPGQMWVGTYGQGIVTIDVASGEMHHLRHDPTRQSSLADDVVHALYRDHAGTVWAGVTGTVSHVDPTQDALLPVFGGTGHTDGLSDIEVWSILPTKDGHVWVGQRNHGIDILDPVQGRRVASFRPDPAQPSSALPPAPIFAMTEADKGPVYAATLRGLYRADPASGKVTRVTVNTDNPQMGTRTLTVIGRTLWIGCTGNGLWSFDLDREKTIKHYGIEQLGDARVETIQPAPDGMLWVGTENGLAILDPAQDKVERILPDAKMPDSLSAKWVSAFLADSRGRQWVGTLGGGVNLFEGRDETGRPRFRHIGAQAGLAHSIIGGLFEDKLGRVWASSDEGLSVIDPDSFEVRTLQHAEGAALSIFRVGADAITPEGEPLFGGLGGLIVARPDRVKPWTYQPPLVVSDLRVGGRPVAPGERRLVLTPDSNSFQVEFAALDFTAPERNRYAYRLDGVDKDWIPSDPAHRLAAYANLPPGDFIFHVRAANRAGQWDEKTLDLAIHVVPAWYQTLWFRLLLLLFGAIGVAAIVASRTAYLRSRQKKLEQLIGQRTASLAQANAALAVQTEQLESRRRQVSELLDNSGEGFFSFDASLLVGAEYSRACEAMLGFPPAGRPVEEVLLPGDPQRAKTFRQIFTTALDAAVPWKRSLMLSLLPSELDRGALRLRIDYKDLGDNRFMVVLSDVTKERHLAHKVEAEHRHLAMTVAAVTESRDFFELIGAFGRFWNVELRELLASPISPTRLLQEVYRRIHTFKGALSQFHFREAPAILQELETDLGTLRFRGEELMTDEISTLVAMVDGETLLDADLAPLHQVLGEAFFTEGSQVRLSADRASEMLATAQRLLEIDLPEAAREDLQRLADNLHQLTRVNLADAIVAFERVILQTAKRLEKATAPLVVAGARDIWVAPDRYNAFLRSLSHVFRNAVAHGIEMPDERVRLDKPLEGAITAALARTADGVELVVSDDGCGVDLDALRAQAVQLGLHGAAEAAVLSEAELLELMFLDSVTTGESAAGVGGRGIGLAAVRAEVAALGGTISVRTRRGEGTSFVFTLPEE